MKIIKGIICWGQNKETGEILPLLAEVTLDSGEHISITRHSNDDQRRRVVQLGLDAHA